MAVRPPDQQFHPDMRAQALAIGRAQKGHRKLDKVDVAGDRRVEDRSGHDLRDAETHQRENGEGGEKVGEILDSHQSPVGSGQKAIAV
jgi:hypothetical protein